MLWSVQSLSFNFMHACLSVCVTLFKRAWSLFFSYEIRTVHGVPHFFLFVTDFPTYSPRYAAYHRISEHKCCEMLISSEAWLLGLTGTFMTEVACGVPRPQKCQMYFEIVLLTMTFIHGFRKNFKMMTSNDIATRRSNQ